MPRLTPAVADQGNAKALVSLNGRRYAPVIVMPALNLHQPRLLLSRKVRFALNTHELTGVESANSFAGRPGLIGFGRHYELTLRCRDAINPQQQYVRDIKAIDRAAHAHIIPQLHSAALSQGSTCPARVLAQTYDATNAALGGVLSDVTLHLTPTYSLMITASHPQHVTLRQRFDFAAAHRLHNPELDDQTNRAVFGKCNNPRGHGHNYQFEPAVSVALGACQDGTFLLHHLESAAQRAIVDRFDHTHLNEDTAEFDVTKGGLIPTVENIAYLFYGLLQKELSAGHPGVVLTSMTVWETDRTSATFP